MTNVEFTSDVMRSATFREKIKGYNPEDVHALMERSAAAIDQLTARLAEATARAAKAEAALASNSEADESVRRTLVLAQRTAEMAVREANDEAAGIRSDARREADELLQDARAEAARLTEDSHSHAHAMVAEAERVRAEADAYATSTVADADAYTHRVRTDTEAQVTSTVSEADAYAMQVRSAADAEAAATLEDAHARATAMLADAEARLADIDATLEAELGSRREDGMREIDEVLDAARQETAGAIRSLTAQRDALWADVETLSTYLASERARVLESLRGALSDFGELLRPAPRPDVAPPSPAPEPPVHVADAAPVERFDDEIDGRVDDDGHVDDDVEDEDPAPDNVTYLPQAAIHHDPGPAGDEPDETPAASASDDAGWGAGWGRGRSMWEAKHGADVPAWTGDAAPEGGAWAGHEEPGQAHAWDDGQATTWDDGRTTTWDDGRTTTWDDADAGTWDHGQATTCGGGDAPSWGGGDAPSWDGADARQWDRGDGWHQPAPGTQWSEMDEARWAASQAGPDGGWAAAAMRPADAPAGEGWQREPEAEAEPVWGQPIDSSFQPGWAADPTAEPAWEWPGRPDPQGDSAATAWFGEGDQEHEAAQGWASEAWHRGPEPGQPVQPGQWAPPPTGAPVPAAWPAQRPTTWSGWADEPAQPDGPRDPWAGIEPVDGEWSGTEAAAARTDDQSPSRLTFSVGDESRAPKNDPDPGQKPRKTLLGRLKG